jgi:hypothetical protein
VKIYKQELTNVVVGKKCDMCGTIEENKLSNRFTNIKYNVSGMQGFRDETFDIDVCSWDCFISALKEAHQKWGSRAIIDLNLWYAKEIKV